MGNSRLGAGIANIGVVLNWANGLGEYVTWFIRAAPCGEKVNRKYRVHRVVPQLHSILTTTLRD